LTRSAIDGVEIRKGGSGPNALDKKQSSVQATHDNDSFNKHYNKDLKVSEGIYLYLTF